MEPQDNKPDYNYYEKKIADNISAMLAYWDKNLVCRFANAAYLHWFGRTKEEMVDKMTIEELLGPIYIKNLPYIKGALSGIPQTFERLIPSPGGGIRHSLANYYPDIVNGEVKGFYVHVADISLSLLKRAPVLVALNEAGMAADIDPTAAVEANLRQNLMTKFPGIKSISKTYGISETKLKADFKHRYNTTIFAFYRLLQMELAHKYLKETRYSKKQLAWMFNFANPSNFSACYKKYLEQIKAK